MPAGSRSRFLIVALLVGVAASLAASRDADPAKKQREVKRQVEEAARKAGSTIDAMAYQRLSPSTERRMLEEVAGGLRGLSEDQLREVLKHLEDAVTAPDAKTASDLQKQAYAKQREVVEQLRGLLFKLDVIKTLEDAAARLDQHAGDQLAVKGDTLRTAALPRPKNQPRVVGDGEDLAVSQGDLKAHVANVFSKVAELVNDPEKSKSLTPEQKDRLAAANVLARAARLLADMDGTARHLRDGSFREAADRHQRHAKELKDLAAALRNPPASRVEALKAAAAKVDAALDAQALVNDDTAVPPTPAEVERAARNGFDPKMVKGNELANRQTRAELAAYDARKAAVQAAAPEAVEALNAASDRQWDAEKALRAGKADDAKAPQDKAVDELKAARAELDRQIAAAELAKLDPLAAVKQAAERVEQLIKDQKDAGTKAEKAEANPARLPDAKVAQRDVAKGTDEVRGMPLPPNEVAKTALDKAAEAMKAANEKLDAKAPAAAMPDQAQALKNLEEAKAALDQQAKEIEQRRADIARLEELKNKLEELAKNEKDVAKEADKAAADPKKPDTGDLAKKQDDLTPPTEDAGQQLKELAEQAKAADPKAADALKGAAEKVDMANMKQDGAKNDLAMNMPTAGGEKAKDAADKLDQAAKDVQAQIDQKKGQEAKDQAALQPDKVDPMNAAQQVQKALEQANMAAQKAMEANMANMQPMAGMPMAGMMPMDGMMPQGMQDLAQLQKDVAKQAGDQKLPEAAKAADMAAEALKKGDIPAAIDNQQKALEQLKQAAQLPMGGMPMDKNGMPMGGMPMDKGMQPMGGMPMDKNGMPMGGMPMGGMPMDKNGMPMGGMPMGGMPMGGMMGMMGQTPGQLAQQQQQLLDATKALQQSQQANNAAQSALQQAQANAPMAVQPQLQQAQNQLQQAQNQLQQGQPGQAGMNQQGAAQALQQALDTLQAAQQPGMMGMGMGMMGMGQGMMGMGMGMGQGMGMGMGMGMMGQGMGMGMGMAQGMGMGMGMGMGSNPQPMGMSEGDTTGTEKFRNNASPAATQAGDGTFINLRKKDRDKVQQGADAQFPAEFRELIKQYNVNIKNAKPAAPGGK